MAHTKGHTPWNLGEKIERTCEICGKTFLLVPSQVKSRAARFCSMTCRDVFMRSGDVEARFWSKVRKDDGDGCWEWTGGADHRGYGKFWLLEKQRSVPAHRYALEVRVGSLPSRMFALHTCDNPRCVRNDDEGWYEVNGILLPRRGHLFLGTHDDNMADMVDKGRSLTGDKNPLVIHPESRARGERNGSFTHPESILRGTSHPQARLNDDDVRAIRVLRASGVRLRVIASQYGISGPTVSAIATRRLWRHIE